MLNGKRYWAIIVTKNSGLLEHNTNDLRDAYMFCYNNNSEVVRMTILNVKSMHLCYYIDEQMYNMQGALLEMNIPRIAFNRG